MTHVTLTHELKAEARRLGFDWCGITSVATAAHTEYFQHWLAAGKAGDMAPWLSKDPLARGNPLSLMPAAKSVIVLGLNYYQTPPTRRGQISRYALGHDYHDLIPPKLDALDQWLQQHGGQQRCAVDTSALMEKPLAVSAGVGWLGKSTMLIQPRLGTWLFLAELITTLALAYDAPAKDRCGSCTRCQDACPTGAITAAYQLDARRCIAYLTIEHQGSIPLEWREKIGDHLYGCDDCLTACPWNRWAQQTREVGLRALPHPDLREMLDWNDAQFRRHFRGTPIFRLKQHRWLRNICVVLGNIGTTDDLPALSRACQHPNPLIAEHANWAVQQILLRRKRS